MKRLTVNLVLASLCFFLGCDVKKDVKGCAQIAVTNSYLASAVRDVGGFEAEAIFTLAPPGMCPGHFDMSPGQLSKLGECRVLFLFDFQKRIGESLVRLSENGLRIEEVAIAGGMCEPASYVGVCEHVFEILCREYPDRGEEFERNLQAVEKKMSELEAEISNTIDLAGLRGTKVISSIHQAEFCRWLGLEVVGSFEGSDVETLSNLSECIEKGESEGVKLVIGCEQQGSELAESLALRLGGETVVFSNFPLLEGNDKGFEGLVRVNVSRLAEAGR